MRCCFLLQGFFDRLQDFDWSDHLEEKKIAMQIKNAMEVIKEINIVKMEFYCVNTSYPMDNSLSGRRGPARQTSEKDVLCLHRLGRPSGVHSPDGVSYFLPV